MPSRAMIFFVILANSSIVGMVDRESELLLGGNQVMHRAHLPRGAASGPETLAIQLVGDRLQGTAGSPERAQGRAHSLLGRIRLQGHAIGGELVAEWDRAHPRPRRPLVPERLTGALADGLPLPLR